MLKILMTLSTTLAVFQAYGAGTGIVMGIIQDNYDSVEIQEVETVLIELKLSEIKESCATFDEEKDPQFGKCVLENLNEIKNKNSNN